MKKLATCILLFTLSAAAQQPVNAGKPLRPPKEIQIGTFRFFGTSDPNCGQFCDAGYDFVP